MKKYVTSAPKTTPTNFAADNGAELDRQGGFNSGNTTADPSMSKMKSSPVRQTYEAFKRYFTPRETP